MRPMTTIHDIPDWFTKTKEGRKLALEAEASALSARADLRREIESRRLDVVRSLPALEAKIEKATQERDRVRAIHHAAEDALGVARHERLHLTTAADSAIGRAEQALRATADPAIWRFRDELIAAEQVLRFGGNAMGLSSQAWSRARLVEVLSTITRMVREDSEALTLAEASDAGPALDALRDELRRIADGEGEDDFPQRAA